MAVKQTARTQIDPLKEEPERKKARYRHGVEQVPTVGVSIEKIVISTDFRQGVADARAGRPPRYDGNFELMPVEKSSSSGDPTAFINRQWNYERGRLFGTVAPKNLHIISPRTKQLNPKAVRFYAWFRLRGIQ
jgi:hypothetical protein